MASPPIFTSRRPRSGNAVHAFRLLDLTLPSPVENLALDFALLDELDERGGDPILRFWESDRHFVVLGPSCRLIDDVHVAVCEAEWCAGAQARKRWRNGPARTRLLVVCARPATHVGPRLANLRSTNQFILERMATALHRWEPATVFQGISDLAIGGRKVSGNAQRRKRNALLFHGTILYAMESDLIARYLKHPARQPEYRKDRPHGAFLRTIDASPEDLKQAIAEVWHVDSPLAIWPEARMVDSIRSIIERTNGDRIAAGNAGNTISLAEEES